MLVHEENEKLEGSWLKCPSCGFCCKKEDLKKGD